MNDTALPMSERQTLTLAGESFSCLHYSRPHGGNAPLLHWTHATGFNALTYRSLLAPLAEQAEIMAMDMRGHGFSQAAADPAGLGSWDMYRDDLVRFIDAVDRPLYLAGHSFGAVVSIGAALKRPRHVRGLILVEPVLLSRFRSLYLRLTSLLGLSLRAVPLVRDTARRRAVFPDRQAALRSYRGKGAFRTWPEEWLRDYLSGGLCERDDGEVELCCAPAWEARSFAVAGGRNSWPRIRRLHCPVTLMTGDRHSTCDDTAMRRFMRLLPSTTLEQIPGASHFLPMEYPQRVRARILETLAGD